MHLESLLRVSGGLLPSSNQGHGEANSSKLSCTATTLAPHQEYMTSGNMQKNVTSPQNRENQNHTASLDSAKNNERINLSSARDIKSDDMDLRDTSRTPRDNIQNTMP